MFNHVETSFRLLYQCQSKIFSTFLSKITKYNRAHLGSDPASLDCLAMPGSYTQTNLSDV